MITITPVRDNGLPDFSVSGGPLASPLHMGWHIKDEAGRTLGVSCDREFVDRLIAAERFVDLMKEMDGGHNLIKRIEEGYINAEKYFDRFLDLANSLGIKT